MKKIMYNIGQLVRCVYDMDIPGDVFAQLPNFPVRAIGLMSKRGDLAKANQQEIARIMHKIPGDLEELGKVDVDSQGAFWIGYYHYGSLIDKADGYTADDLIKCGKALYGDQWQSNLARDLELSDARRIRAWLSGERKIPVGIWGDISMLLRERQLNINILLDSKFKSDKEENEDHNQQ